MINLLKTKLWAFVAGAFAILLGLLKIKSLQAKSWKNKAKQAKKDLNYRDRLDTLDSELEQDFSHRAEEAKKDLDSGEIPDHLRKPPRI